MLLADWSIGRIVAKLKGIRNACQAQRAAARAHMITMVSRMRITYHLLHVRSERPLWSELVVRLLDCKARLARWCAQL